MQSNKQITDDWQQCAPGTLRQLAQQRHQGNRRRFMMHTALAVGTAAVALTGAWQIGAFWQSQGMTNPGGIACSDVLKNLAAYRQATLAQSTSSSIAAHLRVCAKCQAVYNRLAT